MSPVQRAGEPDWHAARERLRHMADAVAAIESYAARGRAVFESDPAVQDAILYRIVVLGEAAKAALAAAPELMTAHPEVDWRPIMRMRDRVAHHYWGQAFNSSRRAWSASPSPHPASQPLQTRPPWCGVKPSAQLRRLRAGAMGACAFLHAFAPCNESPGSDGGQTNLRPRGELACLRRPLGDLVIAGAVAIAEENRERL